MKINNDLPKTMKRTESKPVEPNVKQESAKTTNRINDTVEVSAEGKQKAQNANNINYDIERLREQMKSSQEQAKAEAEANEVRLKCLEIARRIMKSDVVPKEDHNYLMKNDAGLYMQATSLKMQNDNPKKHKRLSEDEENGETSETQAGDLEQSGEASVSQSSDTIQEAGAPSVE